MATEKEIKEAYYKLAKQYHPDIQQSSEEGEEANSQATKSDPELFKLISEAYSTLNNSKFKAEYDRLIMGDRAQYQSPTDTYKYSNMKRSEYEDLKRQNR